MERGGKRRERTVVCTHTASLKHKMERRTEKYRSETLSLSHQDKNQLFLAFLSLYFLDGNGVWGKV
jgi:hypothetical protein